jgi:thiol-disulfide isomerase/thioredoxin
MLEFMKRTLAVFFMGSVLLAQALKPGMPAPPIASPPLDASKPFQGWEAFRGNFVVIDFWATWCGPCKAQRPLYEEVEKKFKDSPNVVFLSVNTDEDRGLVAPFIKSQHWTNTVYFDGGLSDWAKVNSIPTTMIVDKTGQISSRMNGFIPDRFVDLLTARIQETLRQ